MKRANRRRHVATMIEWLLLGAVVGVACGVASAIFLHALEWATGFRTHHEIIVYALPLAGIAVGVIYDRWGKPIRGGNNLVIDTVHEDSAQIPYRMGPMVLVGTVLTHLFGGSAGREGTAVQMGGSLADLVAHRFRVKRETRRRILAAGIAGGFGSVFGTPIAGTIFGLEVVAIGRMEYDALFPALVASVVGDLVTRKLGIEHTAYPSPAPVPMSPLLLGKWLVFGLAVAAASIAFVELTHRLKKLLEARIPKLPIRMMLGGMAVVLLWKLVGTSDYLGLGVPMIVRSFSDPHLPWFAFAAKLVFTAVTLSAGFLGGEVTPLFFVGATLGNVLGRGLGIPIESRRRRGHGGPLRRRGQHAHRALAHGHRAARRPGRAARRDRLGGGVSDVGPPRHLPGAAPRPEEIRGSDSQRGAPPPLHVHAAASSRRYLTTRAQRRAGAAGTGGSEIGTPGDGHGGGPAVPPGGGGAIRGAPGTTCGSGVRGNVRRVATSAATIAMSSAMSPTATTSVKALMSFCSTRCMKKSSTSTLFTTAMRSAIGISHDPVRTNESPSDSVVSTSKAIHVPRYRDEGACSATCSRGMAVSFHRRVRYKSGQMKIQMMSTRCQ
ncbi:MAG: chloride channel protein [Minicystis sp.]